MKKLLFYIGSMQLGGANRVMANLTDHFFRQGMEVILVNDIVPSTEVPEYPVTPGVRRLYLQGEDKSGIAKNLYRIRRLRQIIRENAPDVVVSFMGPPNVRTLVASIGLPSRIVVSVRNDPRQEYGTGIMKTLTRGLFRLADGVVFQTQDAADYFSKGVRKKSRVIFNPVNKKFYDHRWKPGGSQIVVVGRLEPQKNPMNVLQAYESIVSRIPGYTLDFYGDGELRPGLEGYVREKGLEDAVRFHGRTDAVETVLENAAAYVLCSDYEGMPNALMEAMAVGVPSISTDCPCGGPGALIQNEDQGLLIPCGDREALAAAMVSLLTDEDKKRRISAATMERARQFRPEPVLKEWEKFLENG